MLGTATGLKDGSQPTGSFSFRAVLPGSLRVGILPGSLAATSTFSKVVIARCASTVGSTRVPSLGRGGARRSCFAVEASTAQRASKVSERAADMEPSSTGDSATTPSAMIDPPAKHKAERVMGTLVHLGVGKVRPFNAEW